MSWGCQDLHGSCPNPWTLQCLLPGPSPSVGTSDSAWPTGFQAGPQGPLRGCTSSPSPLPVGLAFGKAVLLGTVLSRGLCSYDCHRVHLASGKLSIFTPHTLELGPMPTSARSPHFASCSPLDFSRLGASNCQGVRATFSKEFSHMSTPTELRMFFSSTVIQLEGGVG